MKNRGTYKIGGLLSLHVLQLYKLFVVEQARTNGTVAWYWYTIDLHDLT